jgi:hypothetical protein
MGHLICDMDLLSPDSRTPPGPLPDSSWTLGPLLNPSGLLPDPSISNFVPQGLRGSRASQIVRDMESQRVRERRNRTDLSGSALESKALAVLFTTSPQTGRICPDRLRNRRPWPHFSRRPTNWTDLSGSASESMALAALFTTPHKPNRFVRIGSRIDDPCRTFYDSLANRTDLYGLAPEKRRLWPYFLRSPHKPDGFVRIGS